MFLTIISKAVDFAKQALNATISHINTKQKKSLIVGFDCSWSHFCNAGQASEEFIYLDDLEDKFECNLIIYRIKSNLILFILYIL